MSAGKEKEKANLAKRNYEAGVKMVEAHPIFVPLLREATLYHGKQYYECRAYPEPAHGLLYVEASGDLYCHSTRRAEPEAWARAIAHGLLHLGMGHFVVREQPRLWNLACDLVVEKFLSDLRFATPIADTPFPEGINDEERLYRRLIEQGIAGVTGTDKSLFGTAGENECDMLFEKAVKSWRGALPNAPTHWPRLFAAGLAQAVRSAVSVAAGYAPQPEAGEALDSTAARAKGWFISSYPLLGAIAASFRLVEDPLICQRMDIRIAAISVALQEIYINPAAGLSPEELRFVMAHEFLHAALRHDVRHAWRDAYLWNIACDFVINDWLTDMRVGERPAGVLYDAQFKGQNAEAVYDRIVTDLRRYRKLATLRGVELGDILPGEGVRAAPDTDLDAFYRRAIGQGLSYHETQGRGYLPEGLVEEIRALSHPPIPWDVELARWFDDLFSPLEKRRSYARASRRQSATPEIPRPAWLLDQAHLDGRTFGVLLDTSGSMDRALLASALGAIASYSAARDVPAARVVFCDAEAYDQGYMKPDDIAGTVKVRGRGGTVLQPGIDCLDKAPDFPPEAPLLLITDGYCEDHLHLHGREHAFLIPEGARLPFAPKGKVFRMAG
ncbi:MAG: M48 family metalloprotease, partial [Candidatus Accumulibacter sp.]|nr:M48 family metalloprotease [Accumulibacter sp.]